MVYKLIFALSKGRILKETLPLLKSFGILILEDINFTRKLVLKTNNPEIKVLLVKAIDVPIYVQYGIADLGIVGKDILFEHGGEGVYQLKNLNISKCRLSILSKIGFNYLKFLYYNNNLCVATKYLKLTKRYFFSKGIKINLLKLNGSIELSAIMGLSNIVVDLVDTGRTLKENKLIEVECIMNITSRLIVNHSSLKFKSYYLQSILNIKK